MPRLRYWKNPDRDIAIFDAAVLGIPIAEIAKQHHICVLSARIRVAVVIKRFNPELHTAYVERWYDRERTTRSVGRWRALLDIGAKIRPTVIAWHRRQHVPSQTAHA